MPAPTLLTVRADLAATLQAALDLLGWDEIPTAYAYPAESIALPAVVIVPDEPFWQPSKLASGSQPAVARVVRVNLELQLIVPRTELELAIGHLEELAIACGVALTTSPVFRWVDLGQPETIEVEGSAAVLARMAVTGLV